MSADNAELRIVLLDEGSSVTEQGGYDPRAVPHDLPMPAPTPRPAPAAPVASRPNPLLEQAFGVSPASSVPAPIIHQQTTAEELFRRWIDAMQQFLAAHGQSPK